MKLHKILATLGLALGLVTGAQADNMEVDTDITTSETWTADNVYNITGEVKVKNGATLTIEAGTVVASDGGRLIVLRGGKLNVQGTEDAPVIMTSIHDDFTNWREAANEWGGLAIMGNALICNTKSGPATNTVYPTGLNQSKMEGLTEAFPGDPDVLYGGADDNDDSGTITYLSLRYGGRVVGIGSELNGLSLGGVGRGTDIHHIDIMNNVDDGIELFGGTVNIKYFNIWNIGDDSLDMDQGYRGKLQFGLIVQGWSLDAKSGSGVCDNCCEMDGAEKSTSQPITTCAVYNLTVIGQPQIGGTGGGDKGTAWRDNANVQFRNSIFMDIGRQVVHNDESDYEGSEQPAGYGDMGVPGFVDRWSTPASYREPLNAAPGALPGDFNHPDTLYQAQVDGYLIEISDSIFYNNNDGAAYTQVDALGLRAPGNAYNNVDATLSPIVSIVRDTPVVKGGRALAQVVSLDPRAANDAVTSVDTAPADGFFTPAPFRGAFSKDKNWALGWTAADEYGFLAADAGLANPSASIALSVTTSFVADAGVVYTVEATTDGKVWSPIGTVVGEGEEVDITDLMIDGAKAYRAIVQ